MRSLTLKTISFAFMLLPVSSVGMIRVAGIFLANKAKVYSAGNEMDCVAKAVFEEAKKGGVAVDYRLFANAKSVNSTLTQARQIVSENFDIALGTTSSKEAFAVSSILEPARIPFVAATASHPDLTRGRKHTFSISSDDTHIADSLALFSANEFKPRKLAVVINQSRPTSVSMAKQFQSRIKQYRPRIRIDTYQVIDGYQKYDSLVDQLARKRYSLIFIPVNSVPALHIYQGLAKRKVRTTLLGGDSIGGRKQFLQRLGKTTPMIHFHIIKHWDEKLEGNPEKQYRSLMEKHCAEYDHTMMTAASYDAARIVLEAIKKKQKGTSAGLAQLLMQVDFSGVTGTIRFNQNRFVNKPIQLFSIANNETRFWKSYP